MVSIPLSSSPEFGLWVLALMSIGFGRREVMIFVWILVRLFLVHLRAEFELCVVVWFVIAYGCFIV
jgi:hypothetical protein